MILQKTIGEPLEKLRGLAAAGLVRLGVTPNVLTVTGLIVSIGAGGLLALGHFGGAVVVIVLAGAFDMLDGSVARLSGKTTAFGAFLDSSLDRYSDVAIFGGVIGYYAVRGETSLVVAGVAALGGALLISYTRARAECLIASCKVGLFERGERLVTLMLGAVVGNVPAALWVLAVLTQWTVLVRIHHTRRTLARRQRAHGTVPASGDCPPAKSPGKRDSPKRRDSPKGRRVPPVGTVGGQLYHLLFWDFKRGSIQYDVAVLVIAACVVWLPV